MVKNSGSFAATKEPLAAAKVLAATWHVHAAARPRGGFGHPRVRCDEAPLRCDEHCSQHKIFGVLFHFVFSLLRGLVYWTNEDLISV